MSSLNSCLSVMLRLGGSSRRLAIESRESVAFLKYQLSVQRVSLGSKEGLLDLSRAQLMTDPLGRGAESMESLSPLGTEPRLRTLVLSETPLSSLRNHISVV